MSHPCAGLTAKKTACKNSGKNESGGKYWCHIHLPKKEGEEDKPKPSAKKSSSKAAASTFLEDEINDEVIDYVDEGPNTCDLSTSKGTAFHPDKITNIFIDGKNFMNAEHAYHFMKFWYPAPDKIKSKVLEVAKSIFTSRSMTSVRSIAQTNSRLVPGKWDDPDSNGITYGDLVMFTILEKVAKSSGSSFRERIMSVTTDFIDSDHTVTQHVPHYTNILKVLANHLRRA